MNGYNLPTPSSTNSPAQDWSEFPLRDALRTSQTQLGIHSIRPGRYFFLVSPNLHQKLCQMDDSVENIDPSGDLLIILDPPKELFAWRDRCLTTKPEQFKARVSSAVLRSASRVLYMDLDPSGPWKQSTVQSDGLRHKHLAGFHPDAMRHVLNIMHFRNSLIPETLDPEDLAKIAVIVDYLECHEATALAARTWTQDYEKGNPKDFSPVTGMWLFSSIVFSNDRIFRSCAIVAITLAFPARIVGKVLLEVGETVGRRR
ncbi:hypothetical protein LLEC1_05717 [Akanthomyces lecanii]|uniref:BTB domain-containing protein n=1 Tax=Cordyceps confragosa TaxID=2714763 RepID=A0A179IRQ4_CORDF|nr:hypothetical protein LLEC1_05717 [Akanthomyces lecanii]